MAHQNFEFKAAVKDIAAAEKKLLALEPNFIGEDQQKDTYYNVTNGRLKLREGNIENALIFYERPDTFEAKISKVILYPHKPDDNLKDLLSMVHGIKVVVDKVRKIYFKDNVKFHFDQVKELGSFVEVEAIDKDGTIGIEKLEEQCREYARLLDIKPENYIAVSYSDLLLLKTYRNTSGD
jgi:predicted adenylyl cyclase CyaB